MMYHIWLFVFQKSHQNIGGFLLEGGFVIDKEFRKLLNEKLNIYLANGFKVCEISQVSKTILSIIENYFDPDYKKFIESLDFFINNRNENQDIKYSDYLNKMDISSSNNFSVKGFLSKGLPMLFFYMGDDDNPCIKVTTNFEKNQGVYNIELSNNPQVLAKYKKGGTGFNNAYVVDYEFVLGSKFIEKSKIVFAETKSKEEVDGLNVTDFSIISNEHKNFFNLLKNSINSKNFNVSNISRFGLNILLDSFYDEVKDLCFDEYNFSLENIVYLVNRTLYGDDINLNKPESMFLDFVDDVSYETENIGQNKKVKLKIPVHDRVVEYDVIKSEKYLSIDVVEFGRKKCGLMIISTGDGFSVCVTNRNVKSESNKKPSFVLNFSESQIRLISIDDKKQSGENKAFESVVSFDKGFIKLNYSINDTKKIKNYKEPLITTYGE